MKVNTLACDWCPNVVAAVASPTLVVGPSRNETDKTLDLCQGHLGALLRAFVPGSRNLDGQGRKNGRPSLAHAATQYNTKKRRDRERHARQAAGRPARRTVMAQIGQARADAYWADLEPKVLQVMPNGGTKLSRPDVEKLCGLTSSTTKRVLARLAHQGLVKLHGGQGRFRRYERVGG